MFGQDLAFFTQNISFYIFYFFWWVRPINVNTWKEKICAKENMRTLFNTGIQLQLKELANSKPRYLFFNFFPPDI